jgi:hypothetical protein
MITSGRIIARYLDDVQRATGLGAVTMPGHLAETRHCESHHTWEASP